MSLAACASSAHSKILHKLNVFVCTENIKMPTLHLYIFSRLSVTFDTHRRH